MKLKCPVCNFIQDDQKWKKQTSYDFMGRFQAQIPGATSTDYIRCPKCDDLIHKDELLKI